MANNPSLKLDILHQYKMFIQCEPTFIYRGVGASATRVVQPREPITERFKAGPLELCILQQIPLSLAAFHAHLSKHPLLDFTVVLHQTVAKRTEIPYRIYM